MSALIEACNNPPVKVDKDAVEVLLAKHYLDRNIYVQKEALKATSALANTLKEEFAKNMVSLTEHLFVALKNSKLTDEVNNNLDLFVLNGLPVKDILPQIELGLGDKKLKLHVMRFTNSALLKTNIQQL